MCRQTGAGLHETHMVVRGNDTRETGVARAVVEVGVRTADWPGKVRLGADASADVVLGPSVVLTQIK